jgi:uncharacterized protein (TIGR02996 family)
MTGRRTDWGDVQRVALTAGLAWPAGPFWASPLFVQGQRGFDLLAALRGRDLAASVAMLEALLRVLNHPGGGPLFEWIRETPVLRRPAEALGAAALFRDMVTAGALREELVAPLGWGPLPERLLQMCHDICLCFLTRLNEPMPAAVAAAPRAKRAARPAAYRRAVPDPLPIEPAFRQVAGAEGFLRAVAEEPLEDAHRLAFADWLDEQGHAARAQLVRLQCRRDQLLDHPLARQHFAAPIAALLKAHGARWTKGMPSSQVYVEWGDPDDFRRGLLEHAHVRSSGYAVEPYAPLFQAADLRGLRVPLCNDLHEWPWLSRLVTLDLTGYCEAEHVRALMATPALAGLVHLGMVGGSLGTTTFRALAESPRLPALTSLDVGPCHLLDEGARALAAALPPTLRKLKVRGDLSYYRDKHVLSLLGVRALASTPALAGLEYLDLTWNRGGPAGVESLAASPFLTNLTTLVLDDSDVGNKGAAALAASPFLKRLTCLGLHRAGLRDDAARDLAGSANLAGLTVLDLSANGGVGEEGIVALAASPHLGRLRALSLAGLAITERAAKALVGSPHLADLDTLDLHETGLDRRSKVALRKRWPFVRM